MTNSLRLGSIVAVLAAFVVVDSSYAQAPNGLPPRNPAPGGAPAGPGGPSYGGGGGQMQAGAPMGRIALIDPKIIATHLPGFNQRLEELQRRSQQMEGDFKARQEAIQKLMVQLEERTRGSREYKELDMQITKKKGDFQIDIEITRKQFQEEQGKIMADAYHQITAEVEAFAEANQIALVIKYDGEAGKGPKDSMEGISREIQSMVMYHNPSADITEAILARLKQRSSNVPNAAGRAGAPGAGPAVPGAPVRRQ